MTKTYRHPALRQLKEQQTRYAPRERRIEQIDRGEQLLNEIQAEKRYPYDWICFRITGFRPESAPTFVLEGEELRHDLRLFLADLSATVVQDAAQAVEPILTVGAVGRRFNVSSRTVNRWRRMGLVARRFVIKGRPTIGFLESSVLRFERENPQWIERGSRFKQLGDVERDEIVRRARRLATVAWASPTEIARRIAKKMNRAPQTVRDALKAYDRDHPDRAIFGVVAPLLDDAAKIQIHRLWRQGVSADVLARQFDRTRSSVYRIINEVRARRLLETKLEFIPHPSFDDPALADEINSPLPEPIDGRGPRRLKPPKGLPAYLADLYENPLLTREQEYHLFRQMNFLKSQAHALRVKIDPVRARASDLDRIEELQGAALAVKNQIISGNLRLVVSIAKRHVGPSNHFFELVSDGNISLIRAVEKFDYSRGNKFSTYASWAIMKNFARSIPEESHHRDRFVTGHEEMFEAAADTRSDERELESTQRRMKLAVKGMLDQLDDREQRIIVSRFGIDDAAEKTLEQLGRELGITKERVRQIESRAQEKLRKFAHEQKLDLPTL